MSEGEVAFTERQWMPFTELSPLRIEIEEIKREIAAARLHGITYSRLMEALKKAHVELDRKILAELAVHDPSAFSKIVEMAKTSGLTPK